MKKVIKLSFITITFWLNVAGALTQGIDFHGMKFSCGIDNCLVPFHYCDKEDSSCLRCNSDICNGDVVDPMFNYYCSVILKDKTEGTTTEFKTTAEPCQIWRNRFYVVLAVLLIVVILALIMTIVFIWKSRSSRQTHLERTTPVPPNQNVPLGKGYVSGSRY